jgi:hypothetical protein
MIHNDPPSVRGRGHDAAALAKRFACARFGTVSEVYGPSLPKTLEIWHSLIPAGADECLEIDWAQFWTSAIAL